MNIQVLWVDDEYKEDFVSFAEQEGIDIHHRKSAQEGIDELYRNYNFYHAVILDAKGILNRSDQLTGLEGLRNIRDYLKELNANNYLPHFIFTGQPDYQTNEIFRESFGEFFTKGKDEQLLVDKVKDAVVKKDEYIVHKKYNKIFESVNNLLDAEIHSYLTSLLVSINKPNGIFDDKLHFTQVRIILERLFRVANKIGLLHDKCIVNGKVNLTDSSLFLAGEETKYAGVKNLKPHFPKMISNAVKDIIFITGAASHSSDPEIDKNINLQEYRSQIKTPYLLYSLIFKMLDILIWFDDYMRDANDYEKNISDWRSLYSNVVETSDQLINGTVINHNQEKGFAFFKPNELGENVFIPPYLVANHSLSIHMPIKVEIEEYVDSRTEELKMRVKRIEV